jgi:predicted RNA-binding Zn-ribbon protein involved in translation (DUF1610 family)
MSEESAKKILRLTCPICETRLKIAEDINRFACLNCGTELNVVKKGNIASLEPVVQTEEPQLSEAEQRLADINSRLKSRDDGYGIGCGIVTMAITLVSCIALLVANALQLQFLFWGTIIGGLSLLAIVLVIFIAKSGKDAAPLIVERQQLINQIEFEKAEGANQEVGVKTQDAGNSERETETTG